MPALPEGTGPSLREHPDPAPLPTLPPPPAPRGRRSRRPRHLPAPGRGKERPQLPLTLRRAGSGRDPSGRTARSTTAPSSSPSHPGGNSSCCLPAGSGRPGRGEGRPRTPGNKGPAQPHGCAGAGDARPERAGTAPGTGIIGHISPPLAGTVPAGREPAPKAASPAALGAGIVSRQPAFGKEGDTAGLRWAGWKSIAGNRLLKERNSVRGPCY